MSRIGNRVIKLPENVSVNIENNKILVKGPKGELEQSLLEGVKVNLENNEVEIERLDDESKKFHGTMNALIKNMIVGVSEGYSKTLETIGVGYRFLVQGNKLVVSAGYSHPIELIIPEGIKVEAKGNTEITLTSIDKQKLGAFAADIRSIRKPEPYKGKGIRYKGEYIRRKEGKKAA